MRIATYRFILVFSMALTAALTLSASQNVVAQEAMSPDENLKQIALTDAQIESFIGAQKEMVPIVAKARRRTWFWSKADIGYRTSDFLFLSCLFESARPDHSALASSPDADDVIE